MSELDGLRVLVIGSDADSDADADATIAKPFRRSDLAEVLRPALRPA
jgi:hypothetical protein